MHEYVLIMPRMFEHACIYLKKQSSEYTRILNVSVALHSIRRLCKLWSSYRDRHIALSNMCLYACNQKFFRAGEVSWNQGTSINISSKTKEKRPHREMFYSPRYPYKYILNGQFNSKMNTIRAFFPKSGHFFQFLKVERGGLTPLLSYMPVSVTLYVSIFLNILYR